LIFALISKVKIRMQSSKPEISISVAPSMHSIPPSYRSVTPPPYQERVERPLSTVQEREPLLDLSNKWDRLRLFVTVITVITIYTSVNLHLVSNRDRCERNTINQPVVATVVGNVDKMVYEFDNINCTLSLYGNNFAPINTKMTIFRNEVGECDLFSHNGKCNADIILFNLLYSLVGIGATLGCCLACTKSR